MHSRLKFVPAVAAACAFGLLFRDVVVKLVHDWATDDNYSHGFLIVPMAMYFAWLRREELVAAPIRGRAMGLAVILGALVTLVFGILGAELFLTRIAIVGVVAGGVLFVYGRQHLRILSFPLAFLLLMIPIPAIIFNQIAFPLQLIASAFGEQVLSAISVPVFREGNIIVLPHTTLEVAEACSGIRSLVSLLTLGIVYGHFADPRTSVRAVLAAATVPIAIVANGLRVAGTGLAAHLIGREAAEGFFHTFSGWMVFVAAFVLLVAVQAIVSKAASLLRAPGPVGQMGWETR
jgi:exosortase